MNKALSIGFSISKTGPKEVVSGQPVRYTFSGISNTSNVRLDSFYFREYLVNRMRTLIFTTALPPVNIAWTLFIVRRLGGFRERRIHLENISNILREALKEKGYECPSASYIVPMIVGKSSETIQKAEELQRHGFYALPVRPPTVPEGTSRIRFSLTAEIREEEVRKLVKYIK